MYVCVCVSGACEREAPGILRAAAVRPEGGSCACGGLRQDLADLRQRRRRAAGCGRRRSAALRTDSSGCWRWRRRTGRRGGSARGPRLPFRGSRPSVGQEQRRPPPGEPESQTPKQDGKGKYISSSDFSEGVRFICVDQD